LPLDFPSVARWSGWFSMGPLGNMFEKHLPWFSAPAPRTVDVTFRLTILVFFSSGASRRLPSIGYERVAGGGPYCSMCEPKRVGFRTSWFTRPVRLRLEAFPEYLPHWYDYYGADEPFITSRFVFDVRFP